MREENVASFFDRDKRSVWNFFGKWIVKWVCSPEVTKLIAVLDSEIIFRPSFASMQQNQSHIIQCCRRRIYERKCRQVLLCHWLCRRKCSRQKVSRDGHFSSSVTQDWPLMTQNKQTSNTVLGDEAALWHNRKEHLNSFMSSCFFHRLTLCYWKFLVLPLGLCFYLGMSGLRKHGSDQHEIHC